MSSLPDARPLVEGSLRGTIYDFREAGDAIPAHIHGESDAHISIVTAGRFVIRGRDEPDGEWWQVELKPKGIIAFPPGQEHSIAALEAGAQLISILTGKP